MDAIHESPPGAEPLGSSDQPALLTYAELHRLTGLPLGTLYALVAKREIPHTRLGRRLVRFPRAEIRRWLEERTVRPKEVVR
jgi:excisionase family DNA binding protein